MALLSGIWSRFGERRGRAKNARARILLWATLASLIFGAIEFGEPLDNILRSGRNTVRQHEASGDIVVIAIDDHSLEQLDKWPWPRRYHAQLAAKLDELGARRILFDIDFSSRSNPADDKILAATLARLGRKVTLPVGFVIDPVTGQRTDNFPVREFREHVQLANINFRYNLFGSVWTLPYALELKGKPYPGLGAALAQVHGPTDEMYPIDYSVDPRTVPSVSAIDVIEGRVSPAKIAGKDVIIGTTALQLGDIYYTQGYGRMPGVYLHVIGAETLKEGRPLTIGWVIPFLIALAIGTLGAFARRFRFSVAAVAGGIGSFLLIPLVLEANLIFVDILPSIFLLLVIGCTLGWSSFRDSYRVRGTINTISGLPNLNALRQERLGQDRTLIAARIQNYAEIASALPPEEEKALVEQIASRLTLGSASQKLYQGDEGIFVWLADAGMTRAIGQHLDALHALFRSPVIVGHSQLDLTITFGVDAGSGRSLANRLGSALVASDEASSEGLRWKEYDPAKLKDAAWRLSLLSQLDAAIEAGDLWVAYQPKLDLTTREIVGAEALVRWTHPEKGPISPLEFILAAEQSDRIEKLTVFVLERAIEAAAIVNSRGTDFQVSVNLSARLIDHPALVSIVTDLLAKHRLAPNRLSLEITETAALSSAGISLDALLELRYLGVDISIDDYGTGLSTLDYLKKIPATEIKIDKSFIQAIVKNHSDKLLVHSTIQLAHSLGQKVVAEGVEDSETLQALERMGCDLAQGFLIGRPMNFRSLLKQLGGGRSQRTVSVG
jgi:diguanylate cyclase